jgi:hypothetical protein
MVIIWNTLPINKSVFPFYESQYCSKIDIHILSIFLVTIFAELVHKLSAPEPSGWHHCIRLISSLRNITPLTTKNKPRDHYWASVYLRPGFYAAVHCNSPGHILFPHYRGIPYWETVPYLTPFFYSRVSLTHILRLTSGPQKIQVRRFHLHGQSDFNPLHWMRVVDVFYLCTNKHVFMSKSFYFHFKSHGGVNIDYISLSFHSELVQKGYNPPLKTVCK